MASRTEYACGLRTGSEITWHSSGQKWTEARYEAGILRGEVARWQDRGGAGQDRAAARLARVPDSTTIR